MIVDVIKCGCIDARCDFPHAPGDDDGCDGCHCRDLLVVELEDGTRALAWSEDGNIGEYIGEVGTL
jgi:hypothetical protein